MTDIGGAGPLTEAHLPELPDDEYVKVRVFVVSHANVLDFVLGLASWIEDIVDELEGQVRLSLIIDICTV